MAEAAGLYFEEHGPRDAPPLILAAGLGGSASYWAANVPALAERHHLVLYDHRGTGRSSRDVPGDLTLQSLGSDIATLIQHLGLVSPTLVGHAIGGMAGLALTLSHPGLLGRLVVVNGWARLDPHTARCFDTRLALLAGSGSGAYLHAQPLFLYPPQWNSDHHALLAAQEDEQLAHFPGAEMIRRRVAAARCFDVADRLAAIATPTLLVASDDDMLVPPACSVRLLAGIPGAALVRMATGGHACNVTRADDFTQRLLDWLGGDIEE